MNVKQILDLVAADPSKNAKIAILTAHKDNKDLQEVIRLSYDPTVNFYLRKIPVYLSSPADNDTKPLSWALFHLTSLSTRKVTGQAGIDFLKNILEVITEDDAEVIAKVIARDLRSGFSDSTANKVWKNLIPEFPYMRCSGLKGAKLDALSWKEGVYSQEKADGLFLNCNHTEDDEVQLLTRSGTVYPLDEFADLILDIRATFPQGTQSHGELLVKRNGEILPRQIGNGILNSIAKGGKFDNGDEPVYMVWDQILLTSVVSKGTYTEPYNTRFANITKQISNSNFIIIIPTEVVHSYEEALVHYRTMLAEGKEGTIIKDAGAIWRDGTSKQQIKLKLETVVDLIITGFNAGNGKNEGTVGSIICQSSDGMLEVSVSGISDEDRINIWKNKDEVLGKIIAVKSNCIMPPSGNNSKYSLFLPRMEEIREDKTIADSLQRVKDQFESAIR